MEDYPHQSAEEQPTHPRQQSLNLAHPQSQDLVAHQQQALVAVQDLERQRLKSPQDSEESPPL